MPVVPMSIRGPYQGPDINLLKSGTSRRVLQDSPESNRDVRSVLDDTLRVCQRTLHEGFPMPLPCAIHSVP